MCHKLIDPILIVPRLRVTIENLFQVSNQAAYLGCIHHEAAPLTRCMVNRMHSCMDNLCQIVKEIEPRKIDLASLTLDEALTLEGYAEIRRGLIKSWQFVESRERAIFHQAKTRIDQQDGAGQ